jgi:hypothetical protein
MCMLCVPGNGDTSPERRDWWRHGIATFVWIASGAQPENVLVPMAGHSERIPYSYLIIASH